MIDTAILCMAWVVIGYALARIEHDRAIAKYELDAHDDLSNARKELNTSRQFYQRRFDLLQKEQRRMREPERTLVCDILANGALLPDPLGVRYRRSDTQRPLARTVSRAITASDGDTTSGLILRGATEIMPNSRNFAQNTTRSIATKLLTLFPV